MPKGVYKRTEEHKRKLTGIKRSEETRRKISEARLERKIKLGYLNSPETRRRISEASVGKPKPWQRGNKNCLGRKCSEETRRKLSEVHKGDKNSNWKGGITPEKKKIRTGIEWRLWREAVYARDNWTCQKCGDDKGGNLNPHHIQNFADYPELRFAINNGITFCRECHIEFHNKYGRKNNTKEQIEEFLIK